MDSFIWHLTYKKEVFEHYDYQCTNCMKYIKTYEGVVHHKTYRHKTGIYNATAKELIEAKKITVLCNNCHESIHKAESIDGLTELLDIACIDCEEETRQRDLINGRCDVCHNVHIKTLNEYIF